MTQIISTVIDVKRATKDDDEREKGGGGEGKDLSSTHSSYRWEATTSSDSVARNSFACEIFRIFSGATNKGHERDFSFLFSSQLELLSEMEFYAVVGFGKWNMKQAMPRRTQKRVLIRYAGAEALLLSPFHLPAHTQRKAPNWVSSSPAISLLSRCLKLVAFCRLPPSAFFMAFDIHTLLPFPFKSCRVLMAQVGDERCAESQKRKAHTKSLFSLIEIHSGKSITAERSISSLTPLHFQLFCWNMIISKWHSDSSLVALLKTVSSA